ncbi:unnamed protein product [Linum tenue]|uniref:Uncharacterized protein n=1 Tax=Linum tenue TaxID=586396 RepID=A0AAV0RLN7_9ROSI|nr:unnamed protein product [Linum tenue]
MKNILELFAQLFEYYLTGACRNGVLWHDKLFHQASFGKEYALPYHVIEGLVAHFMRFMEDSRIMPAIWHQSLLAFVQRYKNALQKEDKENLRDGLDFTILVLSKTIEEDRFDIPKVPMEEDYGFYLVP